MIASETKAMISSKRVTEVLETNLSRNLAWIGAADAKIAVIFALATAMLGVMAACSPAYGKWTAPGVASASFAAGLLACSIGALTATVFPRDKGPALSLIFFGGVAARAIDDYRRDVLHFDEEAYAEDLIQQTHINARIASTKYRCLKYATMLLYVSTFPWFIAVYFLFRDR